MFLGIRSIGTALALTLAVILTFGGYVNAANLHSGGVYAMTNDPAGNGVQVFDRDNRGALSPLGTFPSGGSGAPGLGNQGGLVMTQDHRYLVGVNAGSDTVFSMRISDDGLELADVVSSGGDRPISVTTHGDLVYVLNAGAPASIAGFTLSSDGEFTPIAGSVKSLSAPAPAPAQIGFSPNGRTLVVSEKATNLLVSYLVGNDGSPSDPIVNVSSGVTPFGFAFDRHGNLVVSEAFGGAPLGSALSSYAVEDDGTLSVISASVMTTQTAACWVVIARDFAFTTNTGSASIASMKIGRHGELTLEDSVAAFTGAGSVPLDMAVSVNRRYMYTLLAGSHEIVVHSVDRDGNLAELQRVGVALTSNGIVAK